jgi:putative transposase
MTAYSLDLREKMVQAYTAGNTSLRKIAAQFRVSKNTVQDIVRKYQTDGSLEPLPARGGKPSQMEGYEAEIATMVSEHPDYTLAEYCEYWVEKTGIGVSESTMCRQLQRQKLTLKKNSQEQSSRYRKYPSKTPRVLGIH